MELTFEILLHLYSYKLYNIVERHNRGLDNEEEYRRALALNRLWLEDIADYIGRDYTVRTRKDDEITKAEIDKFAPLGVEENYIMYLIYVIDYRGLTIPVFADDYGQQDIAWINDGWCSGGSYNFHPEEVFCSRADYYLEQQNIKEFTERYSK